MRSLIFAVSLFLLVSLVNIRLASAQCGSTPLSQFIVPGQVIGKAVAIDGPFAVVAGGQFDPSVHVFEINTGTEIAVFYGGTNDTLFGQSVAISGTRIAVSQGQGGVGESISVKVYDFFSMQLVNEFFPIGTPHSFGKAIAMDGSTLIVGHPDTLRAYAFDVESGEPIALLIPDSASDTGLYGYSVAISGSTVAIGAPLEFIDHNDRGAVYVFELPSGRQVHRFTTGSFDWFGASVAMDESTLAVGAPDINVTAPNGPAVYGFDLITFEQIANMTIEDVPYFGWSIAMSGSNVVVGCSRFDSVVCHEAYVFNINTGNLCATVSGGDSYFGASLGMSGSNIVVGAPAGPAYVFEVCTNSLLGDLNVDCVVDLLDVAPFVDRISTGTFQAEADINQDGAVTLLDVAPFVDLLSGG